jgi:hypothetical protein
VLSPTTGQWQGEQFTIWGAGRDGKNFFNTLSEDARHRVRCFCDVDKNKIARDYHWVMENAPMPPPPVAAAAAAAASAAAVPPAVATETATVTATTTATATAGESVESVTERACAELVEAGTGVCADADESGIEGEDTQGGTSKKLKKQRQKNKKQRQKNKKHKKRHVKRIPIIHFSQAQPPIVCCVAMGRTDGKFEENVASLNLREGVDYWHFN